MKYEVKLYVGGKVFTEEVQARTWEVIDEDDLVDEITNVIGWCIKSIDYREVLK